MLQIPKPLFDPFADPVIFHQSVSNGIVSTKIYDKRDDFDIVFSFWIVMFSVVPLMGFTFLQLIRFARVCSHVTNVNARNKSLTAQLLQQGYLYHKLRKTFSKFYPRHYELVSKFKNIFVMAYRNQTITVN